MSDLAFVTIDPPGARDLDQALHIERRDQGHRVSYAIADVAAFVEPGDASDEFAWEQGVTLYPPTDRSLCTRRSSSEPRCCPAENGPRWCGRSTSTAAAR